MAGVIPFGVDSGTPTAYSVTSLSPSLAAVVQGVSVLVYTQNINAYTSSTTDITLTVPLAGGGTDTKPIRVTNDSQPPPGAIAVDQMVQFNFDGNHWQIAEGFVSGLVSVEQYGAKGDGGDDSVALIAADNAGNLVFSSGKSYTMNSSHTFKSQAVFSPGSTLNVGSGSAVTFNLVPSAGAHQIFGGLGVVVVNGRGLAEWFGAMGDGIADDSSKINAALVACTGVELLARVYYTGSTTITPTPSLKPKSLIGQGMGRTTIAFTQSTQNCIAFSNLDNSGTTTDNGAFEIGGFTIINVSNAPGLTIDTATSPTTAPTDGCGIYVIGSSYGKIYDVKFFFCFCGLRMTALVNPEVDRLVILHCYGVSLSLCDTSFPDPIDPHKTDYTAGIIGGRFSNIYTDGTAISHMTSPCAVGLDIRIFGANVPVGNQNYSSFNEGMVFDNFNAINHQAGLVITGNHNANPSVPAMIFRIGSSGYMRFYSCYFDTCIGTSIVNYAYHVIFDSCWFSNSQTGIGVQVQYCEGIEFKGCQAHFNWYDGVVVLAPCLNFRWIGGSCQNNARINDPVGSSPYPHFYGAGIRFSTTNGSVTQFVVTGADFGNDLPYYGGTAPYKSQDYAVFVEGVDSTHYCSGFIITNNLTLSCNMFSTASIFLDTYTHVHGVYYITPNI